MPAAAPALCEKDPEQIDAAHALLLMHGDERMQLVGRPRPSARNLWIDPPCQLSPCHSVTECAYLTVRVRVWVMLSVRLVVHA